MSKDKIVLKGGYDPDDYRDELCKAAWEESGAKTLKEHRKYLEQKFGITSSNKDECLSKKIS